MPYRFIAVTMHAQVLRSRSPQRTLDQAPRSVQRIFTALFTRSLMSQGAWWALPKHIGRCSAWRVSRARRRHDPTIWDLVNVSPRVEEAAVRYVLGLVALLPFVVLLFAMATRRARVRACCSPTATAGRSSEVATNGALTTGGVTHTR